MTSLASAASALVDHLDRNIHRCPMAMNCAPLEDLRRAIAESQEAPMRDQLKLLTDHDPSQGVLAACEVPMVAGRAGE